MAEREPQPGKKHIDGDGLQLCHACNGRCEELIDRDTGKKLTPGGRRLMGPNAIVPIPRRLSGATKLTVLAGARGSIDTRYFCPACSPLMQNLIDSMIEAIRLANTEAQTEAT